MRPSRVIQGTFLTMLFVQTVGSIDSRHKLPAPKQFVPVVVLWGILFLVADTRMARTAARLSVLVLLTGMVVGPFGQTAITFLQKVARNSTQPTTDFGGGTFGSTPAGPATHTMQA